MHLHSHIFHITNTYHLKNHFIIILPFPLPHFTTNFPSKICTFVSSHSHSRCILTTTKTIQKMYKSQGCCYVAVYHFILTSSHLGLSNIHNTLFSNTCNTDMQQATNHLHHSQSGSTNPST